MFTVKGSAIGLLPLLPLVRMPFSATSCRPCLVLSLLVEKFLSGEQTTLIVALQDNQAYINGQSGVGMQFEYL